ncbi:MAG: endonuclease domain-containing protein [Cellulomonas sp.]|nr:endonuclease domain-containing protein [Cellulomonas sp.]
MNSRFTYVGFGVVPDSNRAVFDYRLDGRQFREEVSFPGGGDWAQPAVLEGVRLLFLLTGVSYYKTGAPLTIDLGGLATTAREREFLRQYYVDGLGEFAHRNGLDLSELQIVGPELPPVTRTPYVSRPGSALIPFGGGLDSIVTVELVRDRAPDAALFIVSRPGDLFDAIEVPARVAGLPIVRAERLIDEQVLRSKELGFLNGHVPVTGIISAIAIVAAALEGRDAVLMSNEWSASSATLMIGDRAVNHQYSKSLAFETGIRAVLDNGSSGMPDYFSLLRPFSELWIAQQFADHGQYLSKFRSCNRAFHIDRSVRLDHWCGQCEKCCFIDLILSPFVPADELASVFDGREPLADPELIETFRRLLALAPDAKPWECVGDETESRAAARLAAGRPDRAGNVVLRALVEEAATRIDPDVSKLLRPMSEHYIPERYAPDAVLV